MKKFVRVCVIGAVALVIATCGANATVTILWNWCENANGGIFDSTDSALADLSVEQLIWSADQDVSAINPGDIYNPTGGDILLDTGASTYNAAGGFWMLGSSSYDATDAQYGSLAEDYFVGGYVYQRVFDSHDQYANSIVAQINGPLLDQDPSANPQTESYLYTTGNYDSGNGADWMPVPEPSSVALFLTGAVAIVVGIRKKRS